MKFYKIKEIAYKLNVSQSKIRYYEKNGLINNIERDKNNNRIFDEVDYELINMIVCMRRLGVPMSNIRQSIEKKDLSKAKVDKILNEHKKFLKSKIEEYQHFIVEIDGKLSK